MNFLCWSTVNARLVFLAPPLRFFTSQYAPSTGFFLMISSLTASWNVGLSTVLIVSSVLIWRWDRSFRKRTFNQERKGWNSKASWSSRKWIFLYFGCNNKFITETGQILHENTAKAFFRRTGLIEGTIVPPSEQLEESVYDGDHLMETGEVRPMAGFNPITFSRLWLIRNNLQFHNHGHKSL